MSRDPAATPGASQTQVSPPARREVALADLSLFMVAVMWGFNFVVIKDAIGRIDPMLYIMLRYIVGFVMMAAILPRSITSATRRHWLYGSVLGVFYLSALVIQTYALQWTTPGKSGFITGLNVAMVPFIYWVIARRSPGGFQIVGALVATRSEEQHV